MSTSHLGIVELGGLCGRMRARSLELFEQTGAWVATTPSGDVQRLFATATHRHAWHAELWADRCPTIPPVDLEALTAEHRAPPPDVDPGDRLTTYRTQLAELSAELDAIATRIDADLDPSTARVIALVRTDLSDLARRCSHPTAI